jgi:hypothetical protein
MARRARKGVEASQILIIVAIVVALGAVAFIVSNRSKDPLAGLTPLPVKEYMSNGNSLSGNVYKLTGIVTNKERYTSDNGQIISIEVDDNGQPVDLGVYVPVELYGTNLDRGDEITSRVEVRTGGILALQEFR